MSLRDVGQHDLLAVAGHDLDCPRCGWPLPQGIVLTVDVPVMVTKAYLLYRCPNCRVALEHELTID